MNGARIIQKINIFLFLIISIFISRSDVICEEQNNISVKNAQGKLKIKVVDGENWKSHFNIFFIVRIPKTPQVAIWLEDMKGKFQATIYVTRRTALQDWKPLPFENKERIKRPYSLPVWTNRHILAGVHPISTCSACHDVQHSADKTKGNKQILDAFTGATPDEGFTIDWKLPAGLKPGLYTVCAEVNQSHDYNNVYKKDSKETDKNFNGVSGQPSIIYKGNIDLSKPSKVTLTAVGHGEPSGKNGEINVSLDGITNAISIIQSVTAEYQP